MPANGNGGRPLSETRFSLLEAKVTGLENAFGELRQEIHEWMTSRTKSPWQTIGLLLGVLVPLAWVFNVYITSAMSPVAAVANQSLATANSNATALARIIEVQTKILSDAAGNESERRANEREFETQVDAMNQSLSVQFANQQRHNSDFQNALHEMGAKMPPAPSGPFYFPNISNREHRKQQ